MGNEVVQAKEAHNTRLHDRGRFTTTAAHDLLTEIVFSYPGLGYLMIEAVNNQDYPLLQGLFLCITCAVLVANWFVDLAIALLDPRARA